MSDQVIWLDQGSGDYIDVHGYVKSQRVRVDYVLRGWIARSVFVNDGCPVGVAAQVEIFKSHYETGKENDDVSTSASPECST